MSIKIKTILFLLLISLVPYTITMFFFGTSLQEEQLQRITKELETQLDMTNDRIDQHIKNIQDDLAFIAKSEIMTDIFTEDLDRRISRLLQNKKQDLHLKGDLYIVNLAGNIIACSDFAQIGQQFNDTPIYHIDVYSPFDHSKIAVLYLEYELSNLQTYFHNTVTRQYFILDRDGKTFFRPYEFSEKIAVKKELKTLPSITIVLEEDKDEAYGIVKKYRLWFFITLLIGGLMILLFALYFANSLIRPLSRLSKTARDITVTQDYTTQVSVESNDELGQMGNSFNKMISSMKDAMDEIRALNTEIEDTQREVVFTMGAIGESRSKETGNHVKRVAEYSRILARHYGLSQEESEMLKQASPMHDIGKVAIPDAILNKPGKFTDEEFEKMKEHARLGYDMLNSSHRPLLKAAAIVAHEHHEKWNGRGYPRGLKAEEIHIYGRITALADVFDALGSDRVYKQAWPDEKIFSLIEEERDEHFDPELVDIFFEYLDEFLAVREKLKDTF
ncbi:HD domain-containing phosphohydrolase [Sulfurimonas sp. C5]|uniref:HD domain-containing phosphohydrolase n=1 Tax=Sulfurimonas sp. C5 TaxID=3036947 RepID=UPI002453AE14|nr:HD domain-containing phosphohydrolase [Sulfurimonas sp. C5]MDH4943773.1 HD domain-containing protein [Sulfurimonas sp. C5]